MNFNYPLPLMLAFLRFCQIVFLNKTNLCVCVCVCVCACVPVYVCACVCVCVCNYPKLLLSALMMSNIISFLSTNLLDFVIE